MINNPNRITKTPKKKYIFSKLEKKKTQPKINWENSYLKLMMMI